jgi:hypothetical protein
MNENNRAVFEGLRIDRSGMPPWVDSCLLDRLTQHLRALGQWLPASHSIEICMTSATGTRMTFLPFSDQSSGCPIPIGLVMRLDLLIRLLESEKGVVAGHIIDTDYYEGLPDDIPDELKKKQARQLPEPFASLGGSSLSGDEFWKRFAELDAEYPQPQDAAREIQDRYLRFAIAFCVLHEASHLLRRHLLVIEKAPDPADARRGAEVDADFRAGALLAMYALNELFSKGDEVRVKHICETLENITYAVCLVLGLFDLEHAAFCDFLRDRYRHPTARLGLVAKAMSMHLEQRFAKDRDIAIAAVKASAYGASDYVSRMDSAWAKSGPGTKRPTSIYLPASLDWVPPEELNKTPLGSLFTSPHFFGSPEIPTFRRVYREAMDQYEQFNDLRDKILKESVPPDAQISGKPD